MVVQPIGPGLADPVTNTHNYLESVAVQIATDISAGKLKVDRKRPLLERVQNSVLAKQPLLDSVVVRMAKEQVMKQTAGNYPAPLKIIDVIRTGLTEGADKGYEAEAKVRLLSSYHLKSTLFRHSVN